MDLKLAWLSLPLLAACASPVDWSKPGATQTAVDADLKACRLAAQAFAPLPRPQTTMPSGATRSTTGTDLDADRQLARAQHVEGCMRSRGYRLVRQIER